MGQVANDEQDVGGHDEYPGDVGGYSLKRHLRVGEVMLSNTHTQFVVGWGTLALINAGLAQGKGRSGLNWWLVSLLFGPIATFFVVLSEPLPTLPKL